MANRLYSELLLAHPEHRAQTAREWLRALLPRLDFPVIESLAGDALYFDPEYESAWFHALTVANRRTGNSDYLRSLLARTPPLPTVSAQLLELELLVRTDRPAAARQLLLSVDIDGSPAYALY